ncbi:MAG TPA: helix-turn-helix domain-containing protein [Candidatus Ruania gallistercoris]|uniref:Helix-turn-helix domain-containing protein n=1 Tax=Candidatus Ruania gallistercoris TaxID=2838746 RepID=A0A9D2EGS5_9MICO|nr:helix-turn-helix domain-containing protein [Candidatus Ruania gallistercoris]
MSQIVDIAAMSTYDDMVTTSGTLLNARSLPRLGTAVRTLRTRRGWTQLDLAQRAGVSRQWLIKLEAGKTPGLEVGMILQVLDSLDASLMIRDEQP